MPNPLAAFYLSLEESPGDAVTLQALADWFEEEGQSDEAACLRWAVRRGLCPYRFRREADSAIPNSPTLKEGSLWWALDDPHYGNTWGHPRSCRLASGIWKKLSHTFEYEPAVIKQYASVREAYEALLAIWSRVPPAQRESRS